MYQLVGQCLRGVFPENDTTDEVTDGEIKKFDALIGSCLYQKLILFFSRGVLQMVLLNFKSYSIDEPQNGQKCFL